MSEQTAPDQPASGPAAAAPTPPSDASTAAIEADIAATRQRLGDAIDELSDRLDVPGRARRRADELRGEAASAARAASRRVRNSPQTAAAGVVLAVAVGVLLGLLRRARRTRLG